MQKLIFLTFILYIFRKPVIKQVLSEQTWQTKCILLWYPLFLEIYVKLGFILIFTLQQFTRKVYA